jgi:hypothetical protein
MDVRATYLGHGGWKIQDDIDADKVQIHDDKWEYFDQLDVPFLKVFALLIYFETAIDKQALTKARREHIDGQIAELTKKVARLREEKKK